MSVIFKGGSKRETENLGNNPRESKRTENRKKSNMRRQLSRSKPKIVKYLFYLKNKNQLYDVYKRHT